MKIILAVLLAFVGYAFAPSADCGDGVVYANTKQTEYDKRFDAYPKIKGAPKFKGGDKELAKLIREKLRLSDIAKSQVFNLNYQFTVTCEGKIKDVRQIGSPKADDWTNIVEIITSTDGSWEPAKKEGKVVDCVYFSKLFVNGTTY